MKFINVRLRLTEKALGSQPSDKDIYANFIASKAPDAATTEEEIEQFGADAVAQKGKTVFARDDAGNPCMWDYQIKGAFKDACQMLSRVAGKDPETGKKLPANACSRLKAYKKEIDGLLFVKPRMIPFRNPDGGFVTEVGNFARPLRAQTAQGERIALADSETVPKGSVLEFQVCLLRDDLEDMVNEVMDYWMLRGISQFRNGGFGTCTHEILPDSYEICDGNGEVV